MLGKGELMGFRVPRGTLKLVVQGGVGPLQSGSASPEENKGMVTGVWGQTRGKENGHWDTGAGQGKKNIL